MPASTRVSVIGAEHLRPNEIPAITVSGANVPEAWEAAVLAVWEHGSAMPTEYDADIDPESRVASMMIVVGDPLAEPRIHRAFPDGLEGLAVYTAEVVDGVHDARIREEGWSYSYHDRLRNWPGLDGYGPLANLLAGGIEEVPHIDQIEVLAAKLAATPHSRRAQAITWNPPVDSCHHEPPCLQRIWCQVVRSGDAYLLEMNTHWRSRDGFKAAFMNIFAITELQRQIAARVAALSGRAVGVGRYVDVTDNFHLYGSYIRNEEIQGFVGSIGKRSFAARTFRSDDPLVQEEFARAAQRLRREA